MRKINHMQVIDPSMLYTVAGLAEVVGRSPTWIKDQMIHTREIRHMQRGQLYLILGQWVIEWAEARSTPPEKDADES